MSRDLFEALPIWAVFIVTCILIAAAMEMGHRIARYRFGQQSEAESSATGIAAGALLGLVSFILAFTFSIAATHFDARKASVLEDANAIGTLYLRTDLMPDPQREEATNLLREYTQIRLDAAANRINRREFDDAIVRSEKIQQELWRLVVEYVKADPTPMDALVVAALNDVIDIHSERITHGVRNRIPVAIWVSLYMVSCLGIASAAYRISQHAEKRSELLPGLVLAFASVITLIADLDDPRHGFLMSDQRPMTSLLASMSPAPD